MTWKNFYWLFLSLAVILLDQVAKYLILKNISFGHVIHILPVLNFTLTYNQGAAFSFLSTAGGWQRGFLIVITLSVSIFLLFWLGYLKKSEGWLAAGLALVFGGAIGNLWDRIQHGYVVDFIQIHWRNIYFPADFNIADSAITLGAFIIFLSLIFSRKT